MTRRAKIQVSVLPEEYNAIFIYCQMAGVPMSKFVRETVLAEIDKDMRAEFTKILEGMEK